MAAMRPSVIMLFIGLAVLVLIVAGMFLTGPD
jgi:hypothetical protein